MTTAAHLATTEPPGLAELKQRVRAPWAAGEPSETGHDATGFLLRTSGR